MNNYKIYLHEFPNGKYYVGLTKQTLKERWGNKGSGYKNQPIYDEIIKYGWDNIGHFLLYDNLSSTQAIEYEKELICEYNSIENGYNISTGGGLGGNQYITIEYNDTILTPQEVANISPNDIDSHDVTTRLSRGWDIDRIINQPKNNKGRLYEYKGEFLTTKQLLEHSIVDGLTLRDLSGRMLNGWDIERCLTQPKNTKLQPKGVGERIYNLNGNMLNSYELWCKRIDLNLTQKNITTRISDGWSVEDAIKTPKGSTKSMKIEYNSKLYTPKELLKFSKVEGLKDRDIKDRVLKLGWSIEEALTKPKRIIKK